MRHMQILAIDSCTLLSDEVDTTVQENGDVASSQPSLHFHGLLQTSAKHTTTIGLGEQRTRPPL